jgi:hypothetical protein
MYGATISLPNTPSWRGTRLKKSTETTLPLHLPYHSNNNYNISRFFSPAGYPGRGREFFFLPPRSDRFGDRPSHLSSEVKQPGREIDHLVPRSRIRGAVPPLPNTSSWRVAQLSTGNFPFTFVAVYYIISYRILSYSVASCPTLSYVIMSKYFRRFNAVTSHLH